MQLVLFLTDCMEVRVPTFSHRGETHFFAHIPKCAGTTLELHLQERFGPLGLFEVVGKSSVMEQHLTYTDALLAAGEQRFTSSFAVVRHPLSRFVSEYNMRLVQASPPFPPAVTLADFSRWVERRRSRHPELLDNHLRPQVDFIGPETQIFKYECGLSEVVRWLDSRFGANQHLSPLSHERHSPPGTAGLFYYSPKIDPEVVRRVARMYAADYERFGYAPDEVPNRTRVRVATSRYANRRARRVWQLRVLAGNLMDRGLVAKWRWSRNG